MAITNHERVGKALELLKEGLAPFAEREFKHQFKEKARQVAQSYLKNDRLDGDKPVGEWDAAALLALMWFLVERRLSKHPRTC